MDALSGAKARQQAWKTFVEGNDASFEAVFKAYYPMMYGYGIKLCQRPELVKDCMQDLFQTLWERRDDLLHISSPTVYLFVSLRRRILRKIKVKKGNQQQLSTFHEAGFKQFCREEIIIKNETKFQEKAKLQQALNQLSPRQREVIYLHFYNGLSYNEIHRVLSINQQSVHNHVYRAMQTLRRLLDHEVLKLVVCLLLALLIPFRA